MTFLHDSVLLEETVAVIGPVSDGVIVDCTLGGGGHSERLLRVTSARVIGIDRDPLALAAATERLAWAGDRFMPVHGTFGQLRQVLEAHHVEGVVGVIADIGVSSPQLDQDERGFSFRREGPIDMRMDPSSGLTAADLIDSLDADELANVIFRYGEERLSRRIARAIKAAMPMQTTLQLAEVVRLAMPPAARKGKTHPATRTFQALRIAVNDELGELDQLLDALPDVLIDGGRAAIITFHSLEDRAVKRSFHAGAGRNAPRDAFGHPLEQPIYRLLKPATSSSSSLSSAPNPRARSARLRGVERLPRMAP